MVAVTFLFCTTLRALFLVLLLLSCLISKWLVVRSRRPQRPHTVSRALNPSCCYLLPERDGQIFDVSSTFALVDGISDPLLFSDRTRTAAPSTALDPATGVSHVSKTCPSCERPLLLRSTDP